MSTSAPPASRPSAVRQARVTLLGSAALITPLTVVLPGPAELRTDLHQLTRSGWSAVPDRTLDTVLSVLAGSVGWAALAWCGLVAVVAVVGSLLGAGHRLTATLLRLFVPRALRAVLLTALGAATMASLSACGPALLTPAGAAPFTQASAAASAGSGASPATVFDGFEVGWPTGETLAPEAGGPDQAPSAGGPDQAPSAGSTSIDPPADPAPASAPMPAGTPEPAPSPELTPTPIPAPAEPAPSATPHRAAQSHPTTAVIVAPGDTLWSIAAASLGPGAAPAAVAAEWPRWQDANAALLTAGPDHIEPGWRLIAPAPTQESPS